MKVLVLVVLVLTGVLVVAGVEDYRSSQRARNRQQAREEQQGEGEDEAGARPPTGRHRQYHHGHHHRDHQGRRDHHHGRGRSRWLPDWAAPWLKGSVDLPRPFNIDWDLAHFFDQESHEWWKGPNVCVTREESEGEMPQDANSEIMHHHFSTKSTCDQTETAYICTTEVLFFGKKKFYTVVYECCHGFHRRQGDAGCPREVHLVSTADTARSMGADLFIEALTSVGLDQMLLEGNYTLFAPLDNAFRDLMPKQTHKIDANVILISPDVQEMAQDVRDILMAHISPGVLSSSKFTDELILMTENPRSSIRINIYDVPQRLMTANCAPIRDADNPAETGMVHMVDGLLKPVVHTLMEHISKDPELSTLKTMLGRIGLAQSLRGEGQYTLFAPTNAAFRKLKPALLQKLMDGNGCLSNLVEAHVLPHVICSSVIQGKVKTRNIVNRFVNLTRTEENKLFVNAAQMVTYDVMATNGVLHVIDAVLVPDEALDILDVAEKAGATEFLRLVEAAGLTKTLQTSDNYTLFIPTNQAVTLLADDVKTELSEDPMALEKIVKFHMVPSQQLACKHLHNNLRLDTLDSDRQILIKEYYSAPFGLHHRQTAQCAPVSSKNLEGCNGMAHLVDQMLLPPKGDIFDVVSLTPNMSRFADLLKKSGVAEEMQQEGPFTMLAPTDEAIEALDQTLLHALEEQSNELREFVRYHIIRGTLCCAGIFNTNWFWKQRYFALEGSIIHLGHRRNGIYVDREAHFTRCDVTATNGVVHAIDHVLSGAWQKYTDLVEREEDQEEQHDAYQQAWDRNWDRAWERMRDWDWLDMGWKWNKGK